MATDFVKKTQVSHAGETWKLVTYGNMKISVESFQEYIKAIQVSFISLLPPLIKQLSQSHSLYCLFFTVQLIMQKS